MSKSAGVRERGICEDCDYLERYDPDASDAIVTECPGCRGVLVIFQDGTVAQPRSEPHPAGVMPASLLDAAFEKHFCPARPGLFACSGCGDRTDDEYEADRCCSGPYEDSGFVKIQGAEPLNSPSVDTGNDRTEGDRRE